MQKITTAILIFALISVVIYLTIATVLIISGKPKGPSPKEGGIVFKKLFFDYTNLPNLNTFTARDETQLGYRYYPAQSDTAIILLHGSGWHSRYFLPLAGFISSQNLANVYTPDLRGHGYTSGRRGDVNYIGQLEDDLADFIALIRKDHPTSMLIVGGHSSGGGLAIRFAGSQYGNQADAYLLLSPYLQYNAPTTRPNSGGWARPYTGRIIGLTLLNNIGIRWFNDLTVIEFNMPKEVRDGTETLSYTYRLNTSYAPRNYKKDLSAITQPLFVVAGAADEVFFADQFEPVISQFTKGTVVVLENVTHMGVVVGTQVRSAIKKWLEELGTP
ncbi:MAG TPA: alpha/beta fold hydrolase [Syntrophales bacterium]|nr:alpha/beta fold hydrolase [Syntrophales bacterium]HPQ43124.1 alpha/beta fold hydrolase [Syntrophales bacterium]